MLLKEKELSFDDDDESRGKLEWYQACKRPERRDLAKYAIQTFIFNI